MKRNTAIRDALGFNDVLLVPSETQVRPADVSTKTQLTRGIELNIPLVSAGRDNVTESALAIAIARAGGIGVIHGNMPLGKQVEEVRRVKRAEGDIVSEPITTSPDASVAEALDLMTTYGISGLPVIEQPSRNVVGIITRRDVRFFEDVAKPVKDLMTTKVVTVNAKISKDDAKRLMHENRIEKLVVVDDQGRCAGLLTVKDFEKLSKSPDATRDAQGRLRVAAAVGYGKEAVDRAVAMADAGLDAVFVDVAHAAMRDVISTVSAIRQQRSSDIQVIAGNVVTADAARSLMDAGADAIKVGIGGCATDAARRLAGLGVPQITALVDVSEQCQMQHIPVIADGGLMTASDIAKAIAAGAGSVMVSDLFAGTDEAPGRVFYQDMLPYKIVNPGANPQQRPAARPDADAFRLGEPEVDTSIPYRGSVANVSAALVSGLRVAMAYTGSRDIAGLQQAELVRVGA